LQTTETAPACKASSVSDTLCSVSPEQITTGVGRSRMIWRRKVSPSTRGISMSSTMTSGHSCSMYSRAKTGSDAWPMTRIPDTPLSMAVSAWRITTESSTIRMRASTDGPPMAV
jgi:hypothetical protein